MHSQDTIPKINDFLVLFADHVEGDGAQAALQDVQGKLRDFKDVAKCAKVVVTEVFLLKALQNQANGRSSGNEAEVAKAAGVVAMQLSFLPGNVLDMTEDDIQPALMKLAKSAIEADATAN